MTELMCTEVQSAEEIMQTVSTAAEIWKEYYTPLLGAAQVSYMVGNFQSEKAVKEQIDAGYTYFLLKAEGETIGYAGVQPREGYLFLSKLYIKRAARRKGFASQALSCIKEFAAEKGLFRIRLTVNKGNANSITVYENWGFVIVDSVVTDIGCGFVMDDYVMELEIWDKCNISISDIISTKEKV